MLACLTLFHYYINMNEIELYEKGHSIPEISNITGIARSTIRFRLHKKGLLRSRADAVRLAGEMGRLGSGLRGKKRPPRSDDWCKKISISKTGVGIGFSKKPSGYLEITMGENKGRPCHVVVVEEKIGRRLYHNECVHHINHIKDDNRIENLELMTKSDHSRLHAKENYKTRKINKKGQFQ